MVFYWQWQNKADFLRGRAKPRARPLYLLRLRKSTTQQVSSIVASAPTRLSLLLFFLQRSLPLYLSLTHTHTHTHTHAHKPPMHARTHTHALLSNLVPVQSRAGVVVSSFVPFCLSHKNVSVLNPEDFLKRSFLQTLFSVLWLTPLSSTSRR